MSAWRSRRVVDIAHHNVGQIERGVFGIGFRRDRLVAVGASLTAVPVKALFPVIAAATPSLTLVATVKLPLKLGAGERSPPAAC